MAALVLSLKLTLAPALVATATRVAGRLGHRVGGLVGGLPVVAAPIVLIYALEHGASFAAHASAATVLGVFSLTAFCAAYALVAGHAGVAGALAAGWGAFGLCTLVFCVVRLPLGIAAVLSLAAVALTARGLARRIPERVAVGGRDLMAARLIVTAAMVLALTSAAGSLSPWVSGLLAPFPIITAVLAGFTQAQLGSAAAVSLLAGLVTGLFSFVLFFVIVAAAVPGAGVAWGFALAAAAALACHAVLAATLRS